MLVGRDLLHKAAKINDDSRGPMSCQSVKRAPAVIKISVTREKATISHRFEKTVTLLIFIINSKCIETP